MASASIALAVEAERVQRRQAHWEHRAQMGTVSPEYTAGAGVRAAFLTVSPDLNALRPLVLGTHRSLLSCAEWAASRAFLCRASRKKPINPLGVLGALWV